MIRLCESRQSRFVDLRARDITVDQVRPIKNTGQIQAGQIEVTYPGRLRQA
jgi:hypothetical protein